jgi:hypothetical protein
VRSFGQFVRPTPKSLDEKQTEAICNAFGQGQGAARRDRPRSDNPHMPSSQEELWHAWNCGYDEESPTYAVVRTDLVTPP